MNFTAKERERFDFAVIANWIPHGERVLDLGCGDGKLLRYLRETKGVIGYGVEIDHESVLGCIRNGVDVIQIDIEGGLSGFENQSFNHVIISQALQAMHTKRRPNTAHATKANQHANADRFQPRHDRPHPHCDIQAQTLQ